MTRLKRRVCVPWNLPGAGATTAPGLSLWAGRLLLLFCLGGALSARAEPPCGCADVPAVVAHVRGAIVGLTAERARRSREFESFFQTLVEQGSAKSTRLTLGSGVVIDRTGIVLTSYHVVREAQRLSATVPGRGAVAAELVTFDEDVDLALLRLETRRDGYAALKIANVSGLSAGETVLALGSPLGLDTSVSVGVVSALGRALSGSAVSYRHSDLIQTDAAIHPGNSGGPLVNLKGEVVGINTAAVPAFAGIGFAVPAERARALVAKLPMRSERGK